MSVRTDKPPWASLQPPGVVQNQDEDLQRLAPPGMDSAVPSATHMVLHPPFLLAEPADCAGPQRPGSRPLSAQLLATARSSASRSGNLSAATSSLVTLMASVSGQFRPPSASMSPGSRPTSAVPLSPGAAPQEDRPTSAKGGIDTGVSGLNQTLSQRSSANTTPRNRVHPEPVVLPVEELQVQPSATEAWPSRVPTRSGHEEREPLSLPPEAGEPSRPPSASAAERLSIEDVARRGARSPAKLLEHTSD
jgi:hypothetical protein